MKDLKIQYAYKNDKLYHVDDPEIKTGDKCHWVDKGKLYEVYPAKGEKQRAHFRACPGVVIDANRAFHKDCQYYLQETKILELQDVLIQASEVLLEHEAAKRIKKEIPNYSMIPDVLFLDDQGEIMCILEVWYTHKKSEEDIKKIQEYKIITIELKYEKDYKQCTRAQGLFDGAEQADIDKLKTRIKRGREYISLRKQEIRRAKRDLLEQKKLLDRIREDVMKKWLNVFMIKNEQRTQEITP